MRREKLSLRVQLLQKCDNSIVNCFVCEFVVTLAEQLVSFTSLCLRHHIDDVIKDCEIVFDHEQRETLHYIGGSIIHTMRLNRKKFPENPKWIEIEDLIDCIILEDNFWKSPSSSLAGF